MPRIDGTIQTELLTDVIILAIHALDLGLPSVDHAGHRHIGVPLHPGSLRLLVRRAWTLDALRRSGERGQ